MNRTHRHTPAGSALVAAGLLALTLSLLVAAPGVALEKSLVRYAGSLPAEWEGARSTTFLSYFNICSGWVWAWSDFADGDRIALEFDACETSYGHQGGLLHAAWLYFHRGAPPNYGYTAQLEIYERGPDGCPTGTARARRYFLPHAGWNQLDWSFSPHVAANSILVATFHDELGFGNPVALASDTGVNPTGPPACGTCYYPGRETHSGFVPRWTNSYCPPEPLADEECEVEWLASFAFNCPVLPTSLDDGSWGSIKALYR